MSLLTFILIILGVTALLLWLTERYIWPTPSQARTIVFAVIVALVLIWIILLILGVDGIGYNEGIHLNL
jgi:hypothetical protein